MITTETVKKVAKLAKIRVVDEDLTYFSSQIQQVMNMISSLEEIDCRDVIPLVSVNELPCIMRSDIVQNTNSIEDLFANINSNHVELAKNTHYYVVPKVIE